MMLFLTILALSSQISSHPVSFFSHAFVSQADHSWFWGWAWGAESTVSIVDRYPVLSFDSRPAAFGPDLVDPLLGYVIPLSSFTSPCPANSSILYARPTAPNLGCPDLCVTGPNEPNRAETWIALVQRGECQFVEKVREAQRLGANAVVVGGDNPNISGNPDVLVNMYSPEDSSDVAIASTFIKYSDYTTLSALIATSNTSHSGLRTLSLLITTEYSAWEWWSPIITFIIILVLPSLLTLATLLIHRVRAARAAQRDRAPEDIVKCLPWRVWTGTGWEKHEGVFPGLVDVDVEATADAPIENLDLPALAAGDPSSSQMVPLDFVPHIEEQPWAESQHECAICLSTFVKGDRVRELPCQHIFHLDEVDAWLIQRKKLCPVCKADVTQPPPGKATLPHPTASFEREPSPVQIPRPASRASATERTPLLTPASHSLPDRA